MCTRRIRFSENWGKEIKIFTHQWTRMLCFSFVKADSIYFIQSSKCWNINWNWLHFLDFFFCEQNEKQKEERSENILSQPIIFRSIETYTVNKIQQVMNEIYSNNENPSQRKKIKENLWMTKQAKKKMYKPRVNPQFLNLKLWTRQEKREIISRWMEDNFLLENGGRVEGNTSTYFE